MNTLPTLHRIGSQPGKRAQAGLRVRTMGLATGLKTVAKAISAVRLLNSMFSRPEQSGRIGAYDWQKVAVSGGGIPI